MRFIDLFAGVGGFRLAFERAGFKCVWSCEIDRHARQIYSSQFQVRHDYPEDIRKVVAEEVPDHEVLTAGFPCQAFSLIGRRRGFEDARGTLFFEICRILGAKKPRVAVLENVKGLLSHDGGRTFETILRSLAHLGYDCEWQVLNCRSFGVPQARERVFIVCHLRAKGRLQIFPTAYDPRPEPLPPSAQPSFPYCYTLLTGHRQGDCNLVLTRQGYRWLTPLEFERLQSFPDGWTEGIPEGQRYKCMGNAVNVTVVERGIARPLKTALARSRRANAERRSRD